MKLSIIEQDNQRVLTTAQLAESYGANNRRISENFKRNEKRFKEEKHFFSLQGQEKHDFLNHTQIEDGSKNAQTIYLWTEKGAWLHAKSLNTDEAWDAYEMLVDEYYNIKQTQIDTNQLSPELQMFKQIFDSVAHTQLKQQEQDKRLDAVEKKQDSIKEVLSLNPVEWRNKVTNIIKRIGTELGGGSFYQQMWKESYELLEQRARCDLGRRRSNLRQRMAEEGVPKSKRDKVSMLDIIEKNARLTEIYLAIVKEMAIKYGVEVGEAS